MHVFRLSDNSRASGTYKPYATCKNLVVENRAKHELSWGQSRSQDLTAVAFVNRVKACRRLTGCSEICRDKVLSVVD